MAKSAMQRYAEFVDYYYHFDVCDENETDMDNVTWIQTTSTFDEAIGFLESAKDDYADNAEGLAELEEILKGLKTEKTLNAA